MNLSFRITSLLGGLILSLPCFAQFGGGYGSGFTTAEFSASALPLTLLEFTGRADGGMVRLDWSTIDEIDTDYFLVERTTDGSSFAPVGRVAAAGESRAGEVLTYTLEDDAPIRGTAFYRLKSVDLGGTFSYSSLVEVSFGKVADALTFQISPNPSAGKVIGLDLATHTAGEALSVAILDAAGRQLVTRNLSAAPGERVEMRLRERLPVGTYLLRISQSGAVSHTERLIIALAR